jgi:K+-transporting ATPase ATPase A chain
MTLNGFLQIGLFFLILLALVKPLGSYMARVYEGTPTPLDPVIGPIESAIYRLGAVRATEEMDWKTYGVAMLLFSAAGLFALYVLQRLQGLLPLNPQGCHEHQLAGLCRRSHDELFDQYVGDDRAELRCGCHGDG